MLQNYLACGTNTSESADFYSLNAYEWCGSSSSYEISGYSQLNANVTDYNIPIFFSETGCNTNPPRDFADQAAIFGSDMYVCPGCHLLRVPSSLQTESY